MAHITRYPGGKAPVDDSFYILEIPQELVDIVVEQVAESTTHRKEELHKCALISRAFYTSSSRCLFRSIEVVYDERVETRMKELRKALETNPKLISHIHCLRVSNRIRHPGYDYNISPHVAASYNQRQPKLLVLWKKWMKLGSTNKNLVWFLRKLFSAQVSTLEICGPPGGDFYDASWKEFPQEVVTILLSIAQSHPHLRTLRIWGIGSLPGSILTRINRNSIISLELKNCVFSSFSSETLLQGQACEPRPLYLQHLVVQELFLPAITVTRGPSSQGASLQFSELRFASLACGNEYEATILRKILESNAPLLKKLHIMLDHKYLFKFESLLLIATSTRTECHLATLEELSVECAANMPIFLSAEIKSVMQIISLFFNFPVLPPSARTITIEIYTYAKFFRTALPSYEETQEMAMEFITGINSLDSVLCNRARYPKLEQVQIRLISVDDCNAPWCELLALNSADGAILPRLASTTVAVHISLCHSDMY